MYEPVKSQSNLRLIFIFKCILGIKIHSIYFYNAFEKAKKGKDLHIEISTNFNRGREYYMVVNINRIIYGKLE